MRERPVPDLGTLRSICQSEKVLRDRRFWYVWTRRVSIAITWALLHTRVSPNQVTLVSLLLTVAGGVLLALPSAAAALMGAGALVLHYFLDKVDGEIARFRKAYSLQGVYMDELSHTFAYAGIFAGTGVHIAWSAAAPPQTLATLVTAMVGALAMVMVRQNKSMGMLLFAQNVLEQPALIPPQRAGSAPSLLSREGVRRSRGGERGGGQPMGVRILALVRDLVLTVSEFTVVLVLMTLGLAIEAATGDATFLRLALWAEAALQVAVLFALIWINRSFNLETEVRRLNQLAIERTAEPRAK